MFGISFQIQSLYEAAVIPEQSAIYPKLPTHECFTNKGWNTTVQVDAQEIQTVIKFFFLPFLNPSTSLGHVTIKIEWIKINKNQLVRKRYFAVNISWLLLLIDVSCSVMRRPKPSHLVGLAPYAGFLQCVFIKELFNLVSVSPRP